MKDGLLTSCAQSAWHAITLRPSVAEKQGASATCNIVIKRDLCELGRYFESERCEHCILWKPCWNGDFMNTVDDRLLGYHESRRLVLGLIGNALQR